MLITPEQLKQVATTLSIARAKQITDLLNELCPKYGIDTKDKLHEFLANVVQESMEFRHKEENMNYSAKRITQVWPSRFKSISDAVPYANNPQRLANKVYNGRMGNAGMNDGYIFKGGGFIGITGRAMYTKYAEYLGKDIPETALLVQTSDRYALDSALWFFSVHKQLNDDAERDDFIGIVKSINGGLIGLPDRQRYYERAKKYVV